MDLSRSIFTKSQQNIENAEIHNSIVFQAGGDGGDIKGSGLAAPVVLDEFNTILSVLTLWKRKFTF